MQTRRSTHTQRIRPNRISRSLFLWLIFVTLQARRKITGSRSNSILHVARSRMIAVFCWHSVFWKYLNENGQFSLVDFSRQMVTSLRSPFRDAHETISYFSVLYSFLKCIGIFCPNLSFRSWFLGVGPERKWTWKIWAWTELNLNLSAKRCPLTEFEICIGT